MRRTAELTVENLIDSRKTYRPEVLAATKAYARSKPWRGTFDERAEKLRIFHNALCGIYEMTLGLDLVRQTDALIGDGGFDRERQAIVLLGKISVVTYLHVFTRARGAGRREAFRWSLNLFKRCFPKSFEGAEKCGPYLFKPGTMTGLAEGDMGTQL